MAEPAAWGREFVMISSGAEMSGSYDPLQVALSVLIAISASYAALDLGGRVTAARGWFRATWLSVGAVAMGIGIWSMHFTGMLAFHLPVQIDYFWPTVLASLVVAILAAAGALHVVGRQRLGAAHTAASAVILGSGIAGLHYMDMAAMRLAAVCTFSSFLVALSVLFAITFSLLALWLAFYFRDDRQGLGDFSEALHGHGRAHFLSVIGPTESLQHCEHLVARYSGNCSRHYACPGSRVSVIDG